MKCVRMLSFLTLLLLSLMLSVTLPSCKKGDTGPAGTANVSFSDWFKPDVYKKDTVFGIWGFNYTQAAPAITQNVLDSGTVIVYGKLLGYNPLVWPTAQIAPLPISLTYVQGSIMTDTWSALTSPGQIKIRFINDKNYYGSIANAHQFRYVIIPGGKKITASAGRNIVTRSGKTLDASSLRDIAENYTHMSYEDVCDKLDIPR